MSVFYAVGGAVEEPISLRPTGTGVTDLVEFDDKQEVLIIGLIVANQDASARLASIWYTVASTDYLIYTGSVATTSSVHDILPAPIRLRGKDGVRKVKVQAAAADVVTFTVIYAATNAAFKVS